MFPRKNSLRSNQNRMEGVQNVLSNAFAPVDIRKGKQVVGAIELVVVEVAVSKIVRAILNMENRGIFELAFIHLLSIPFLGGVGAPFGPQGSVVANQEGYTGAFKDGAKGIPGVLVAQYIVNTAYKGFHIPWFNFKDLLITAGTKTITRPLVYSVAAKLPEAMADGFLVLDALINRQVASSNLKMNE